MSQLMKAFLAELPKAELHLHIEGTLEPELMFELAQRNAIKLPYSSVEAVRQAYQFTDLQSFLDIYYQAAQVLITEQDFYDLTWAYLKRLKAQCGQHLELFFDPQTHTDRGIPFSVVIDGIQRALKDGEAQLGISSSIILCFLRHLTEEAAFDTLKQAEPYRDAIIGIGLDSGERGNPPQKFSKVFAEAREQGYEIVAHAGEEGPSDYIWQAINLLKARRIDHGVACDQDPKLIQYLREQQIPLTVCPLSNTALKVYEKMSDHNIVELFRNGLLVTINSDDPAYFGGHLNDNYQSVGETFKLSFDELGQLAKNSILASFLSSERKSQLLDDIDLHINSFDKAS